MNIKRIDIHINKCLDGNGEKDKNKYENYYKYNQLNINEFNDYEKCPLCDKIFYTFINKVKIKHIQECLKKFNKL